MFELIDNQTALTINQYKLLLSASLGVILEFLDYFLIGFILTFIAGPWHLTFGESSLILLSSGVGAIIGAFAFGRLADAIGRRPVFMISIFVFTLGTFGLIFTPDSIAVGWLYVTACRFLIGFGEGGFYCVDLPLVQEFMPVNKRGLVSGLVTCGVPLGFLMGAALVAFVSPVTGWRGVMVICVAFGLGMLLLRAWIPESPRWLMRQGRGEDARRSVAWALHMDPSAVPEGVVTPVQHPAAFAALFRYPRSLAVSWLTNLGTQTGYYGLALWAPALIVLLLGVPPAKAAYYMIFVTCSAFFGRVAISILSEKIGRRIAGFIACGAIGLILIGAALFHDSLRGETPGLILTLMAAFFFGDGAFPVVGPYAAEVWPSELRATGMGSAYGFGGIGKVIGPLGLALFIGSSVTLTPKAASIPVEPAFLYFAGWWFLSAFTFLFFAFETKGRSIETIDRDLLAARPSGGRF
jgi:MFS transporter, putative metabolite:H+ symporter